MGVISGGDRSAAARLFAAGADLVDWDGDVLNPDLNPHTGDLPPVVTTDHLPTMAVHAARGPRVIRTNDVRAARRVCDVIAAVRGAAQAAAQAAEG